MYNWQVLILGQIKVVLTVRRGDMNYASSIFVRYKIGCMYTVSMWAMIFKERFVFFADQFLANNFFDNFVVKFLMLFICKYFFLQTLCHHYIFTIVFDNVVGQVWIYR